MSRETKNLITSLLFLHLAFETMNIDQFSCSSCGNSGPSQHDKRSKVKSWLRHKLEDRRRRRRRRDSPPMPCWFFPQWVSQKWQHTPVWLTPSLSLFWWVGNNLIAKSLKLHVNPSRCETQLLCVLLYMWYHHAVSSYYRFSSSDFVLPSCLHTYTSGVTNVITCLKTQAVTMPMRLNDVVLHYSSNLGNHTVTCSRC